MTRAFESIAHKNGVQIECNACVTSLNLQALSSEPAITSVASSHRRISSATVARSAAVPREVSASDASFHCSSQADRQLYAPGSSKGGEEKKDRDEDGMEVGVDVMTRDVKSTLDEAQADVFVINIDAPEAERSLIAKIVPGISRESGEINYGSCSGVARSSNVSAIARTEFTLTFSCSPSDDSTNCSNYMSIIATSVSTSC